MTVMSWEEVDEVQMGAVLFAKLSNYVAWK